ncbi:MAG: hypothetical protein EXS27_09590, partial [Pedosphaera sp.]|nr:hypothetical protein [Pedosphaera sp.]
MKHAKSSLARLLALWLACGSFSLVLVSPVFGADKPEKPATAASLSLTGKWTYTLEASLDTSVDFTAEFKQDGE